jgi:flagellar L-ring protein precursor FlgH
MKRIVSSLIFSFLFFLTGCISTQYATTRGRMSPAEAFSQSARTGEVEDFSIFKTSSLTPQTGDSVAHQAQIIPASIAAQQGDTRARLHPTAQMNIQAGDPKFTNQGLSLKRSIDIPGPRIPDIALNTNVHQSNSPAAAAYAPPKQLPFGSGAPYATGQMTANPSLWPDEKHGSSLFRDLRAFRPMDILTILVNERTEGRKIAETDTERRSNFLGGISEFFGLETRKWAANNDSLDPAALINAETNTIFEGTGETTRTGELTGQISAVVVEVLPNNILRVEGTKIVSVNDEEEILVVSGLVRPVDVDSNNSIRSSQIANMRIDFYGQGIVAENQTSGWLARILSYAWPF